MKNLLYQIFGYNYFLITLTFIKMLLYGFIVIYILENVYIRDISILDNIKLLFKKYWYYILKWSVIYIIIYYLISKYNTIYWLDFSESIVSYILPNKSLSWLGITNILKQGYDYINIRIKNKSPSKATKEELSEWLSSELSNGNITKDESNKSLLINNENILDIRNESILSSSDKENIKPNSSLELLECDKLSEFKKDQENNSFWNEDPFENTSIINKDTTSPLSEKNLGYNLLIDQMEGIDSTCSLTKNSDLSSIRLNPSIFDEDKVELVENLDKLNQYFNLDYKNDSKILNWLDRLDTFSDEEIDNLSISDTSLVESESEQLLSTSQQNSKIDLSDVLDESLNNSKNIKLDSFLDFDLSNSFIPFFFIQNNIWKIIIRILFNISLRGIISYLITFISPWLTMFVFIDISFIISLIPTWFITKFLWINSVVNLDEDDSKLKKRRGIVSSHTREIKALPQLPLDHYVCNKRPPTFNTYNSTLLEEELNKSRRLINTESRFIEERMRRDGTTFVPGKYSGQTLPYSVKRIRGFEQKGITPSQLFWDIEKQKYSGVPFETINSTPLPKQMSTFEIRKLQMENRMKNKHIEEIKKYRQYMNQEINSSKWYDDNPNLISKIKRLIKKIFKI